MKLNKRLHNLREHFNSSTLVRWLLLIIITAIFAVTLYPNLMVLDKVYGLGDIAERDIKAPKDFFVEDEGMTQKRREQAKEKVLTVYDDDVSLTVKLNDHVKQAFASVQALFKTAESKMPPLTERTQLLGETVAPLPQPVLSDTIWEYKKGFEDAIGFPVSNGAYAILEKEQFSSDVATIIQQILSGIMAKGVVNNKTILLKEADKGITLRDVKTQKERTIKDLSRFYDLAQAKATALQNGSQRLNHLDYNLRNLIIDFVQQLVQPNITLNRNETEERRNNASDNVEPILYRIKAGEMIVREGERITESQLVKLVFLQAQSQKTQLLVNSTGAALIVLCLLVVGYTLYTNPVFKKRAVDNKNFLFVACTLVMGFLMTSISASLALSITRNTPFSVTAASMFYGIPLAAAAMLVCMFLGLNLAVLFTSILATCATILLQNQFDYFIYFLLNGVMGAYWMQDCRERKIFIHAGLKLSALNLVMVTAIHVFNGELSMSKLLWDWIFAVLGGMSAGVVTAGIAPLMEIGFGYTTDITLLEQANLDQPILRRLMLEAPGTYHHSVLVGTMVEAAAAQIGANPLLGKVCGYYHDIGKINKPLYFIENQANVRNRHDKLAPSMSSLILTAHVKDGVEIAKKYKLGQAIIDTIRQHHGKSLIKFFYEKAKQLKGEEGVNVDDFRYPGPKPQTREAGLVMLADVVEASSRTMANPTPSRIQGHVQTQINTIFSDGQLENCELTLKDLHKIAQSFNKILNGVHHHRVEYPERPVPVNGKSKKPSKKTNGHTDHQSSKPASHSSKSDKEDGTGRLKRLGVS